MTTSELVIAISHFANSFNVDSVEFITEMNLEHRTIQQSFTKLCLEWLENCADINYRFDGRNQATHDIAVKLIEHFKYENDQIPPSKFLPMV